MLSITCPSCQAQLKVPESLAGRKAKCTKCGTVLQIPGAGIKAAAMASAPARGSAGNSPPGRAPAARRPARADDFEDDRPRRRQQQAKGSSALLIGIISAVVVVLIGGGVLAAIFFLRGSPSASPGGGGGAGGAAGPSAMQFMPDNAPLIASIRIADVFGSDAMKALKQEVPQLEQELTKKLQEEGSVAPSDIARFLVGGADDNSMTVVIQTTKQVTAKEIQDQEKNKSFKEVKVGSYTMYEAADTSFCVVTPNLVVGAKSSPVLKAVLERNGPAKLSANMQAALANADMNKAVAVAVDVAAMPQQGGLAPGLPIGGIGPGGGAPGQNKSDPPDSVAGMADVGKDVAITAILGFKDAATAQAGKQQFDQVKAQAGLLAIMFPKELIDIVTKAEATVGDNKLTVTSRFDVAPVARAVKGLMAKQAGFGPNPFPQPGPNPFPQPPIPQPPFPQPVVPPQPGVNPGPVPPPTPLPPVGQAGINMPGSLTLQDPMENGKRYKAYTVQLDAGKSYQIDLVTRTWPGYDPYLVLKDAAGQELMRDDDGGGFPNARIVFNSKAAGQYTIVCTGFGGSTGDFTLSVREQGGSGGPPPVVPPQPGVNPGQPIALPPIVGPAGVSVQGEVTQQDATDNGRRYKAYTTQLVAGKKYQIDLVTRGGGFDPYLILKDALGTVLRQDDDGGGYPNARIVYDCTATGNFAIVCTGFGNTTGPYMLTVREAAAPANPFPPPNPQPGVGGSLGTHAMTIPAGQEKSYNVTLTAGQQVRFTVTTRLLRGQRIEPDVDLFVYGPGGGGVAQDVRISKDAQVQFLAPQAGVYRVVVRNLGPGTAHSTLRQD